MNISYTTTYDASDVNNWSGLGFNISKALELQGNRIDYIGNLSMNPGLPMRLKAKYYKTIGKGFDFNRAPAIVKQFAQQIKNSIKPDADLVFSPSSLPISLLDTKISKVIYTDSTFAGLIGFYDDYANLAGETIKNGNLLEKHSLESAKLGIFSSDWAAKQAVEFYNINPGKIKVVPFGANVHNNRDSDSIKSIIEARSTKECHLLFIGVDWERKGGDLTLEVARLLNEMGLKTTLHIVGIKDLPVKNLPDYAIDYGFISKRSNEGYLQLESLFNKCHFLLVPSKAEAYGLVFCEANSYGLPALAKRVGGVPTIIKNDINGKLFEITDKPQTYATFIESVFSNIDLYKQVAYSSYNEFISRLNWETAGKSIMKLISEI